jgi:nicotinate-nucleotide--dimethylbenzimidazole phosphoribosyltransferase
MQHTALSPPASLTALRALCQSLPEGDPAAERAAQERQNRLTKPPGSLGRLEELALWLARWQGCARPQLERVEVLVFAGNHGVMAHGVSPYPAAVTGQMTANFAAGGAAINQLAHLAGARLSVLPLALDTPTADITCAPAMSEAEFCAAVAAGWAAVAPGTDLLALGEMGIGNTTVAAALSAALFGGGAERWVGRGTGVDEAGLARKIAAVRQALARHAAAPLDPMAAAMQLGGRELAAILGATLAARHLGVPVLLDGFVCTAAAAPLACLNPAALAHTRLAHVSAERGHRELAARLGLRPLLDLDMRLGEASGAAVALLLARAALACHNGMATFAEAGVADRAVSE